MDYERYTPDTSIVDEADVDNSSAQYASNYETRVSALEFTAAPAADLNGIIALNMMPTVAQPIIIFHNLRDISEEMGTATFETFPGVRTATWGEFQADPEGSVQSADATLNLANGEFEATLPRFDFIATIEFQGGVQRVNIPVSDITISGALQLLEDNATANIVSGNWSGHITRADGDATFIRLVAGQPARPLTELFSETTLNYSTSLGEPVEPGTGDAWVIEAVYNAETAKIVE